MTTYCMRCGSWNPDGAKFCNKCGLRFSLDANGQRYEFTAKICSRCGASNAPTMAQCGACGTPFVSGEAYAAPSSSTEQSTSPSGASPEKKAVCPSCGVALGPYYTVCPNCRARLSEYELKVPERRFTSKPRIAGILMMGTGALAIAAEIVNASTLEIPQEYLQYEGQINFCIALIMVLGVISILGGVVAYRRRLFPFAIVGSIAGMLTFSFFVGFFMGLVALILLALSQKEFD